MSISATHWGSPLAPRRALLIHGLTASSHSWEGLAQLLVAEGSVYNALVTIIPFNIMIRILRLSAESPWACMEAGQ